MYTGQLKAIRSTVQYKVTPLHLIAGYFHLSESREDHWGRTQTGDGEKRRLMPFPKMSAGGPIHHWESEVSYLPQVSHGPVGDQARTQRRSIVGVHPVGEDVGGQPVLDYDSGRRWRYSGKKP